MSNQTILESTLIAAIWSCEKIKAEDFNADMFVDLTEDFRKVCEYREAGHAPGDMALSMQILGNDLTARLIKNEKNVVETSVMQYKRQLEIIRYNEKLYKAMTANEVSQELLEEGVLAFKNVNSDGNLYDLSGNIKDYIEDVEKRIKKETPFYTLGFRQLDEYISPIEPGTFIIVKALKKTGKTNFAIKIFCNMIKKDIPCLYITSEMGYIKLMDKVVSMIANISSSGLRKGNINHEEMSKINDALANKISGKKGFIYQTGMFDIEKIDELIVNTGAKVCFIDYVQMFNIPGSGSRAEELEKIACQIKDIAMTHGIVCIGMSQVNKDGETKHCLSFEEKADQVISLKTVDDTDPRVKTLDVSVDYNRHGPTGMVSMVLRKKDCNIGELESSLSNGEIEKTEIF